MPNHVKTPTGEIHYYATPEETPAKMTDLVDWLRGHLEQNDLHPLELAATFHYRFVAIHPFDDGNGRMSRLLMNVLLMQYGFPPAVIKQQDRQAYYYALRQADASDLDAFVEYVGENLLHSLDTQLKGAKGESMEEPDDLDKEIALLKGILAGKEDTVQESEAIIREMLKVSFIPLFQAIQIRCRQLNDLFYRNWDRVQFARSDESHKTAIPPDNWEVVKQELLQFRPITSIAQVSYEYGWVEFKKADGPFNIEFSIGVFFKKFDYKIQGGGLGKGINISKSYSQKLSPEEFTDLSKIFVREALEQIKARTGKSV